MFVYPDLDPVALRIGDFRVHWYGVMYMLAFIFLYHIGTWRCKVNNGRPFPPELMGDYLFYMILGVIIGGRLGHVIFYNPMHYLANPLDIILIYKGGMSFHGGFFGVIAVMVVFARKMKVSTIDVFDHVCTDMPICLMLGRFGNFINGELWGRVTDVPWAMVFPHVDQLPRHPSMLYEAALEGPILWSVILLYRRYGGFRPGICSVLFVTGYAFVRFLVEYVREPESADDVYQFLGVTLTLGQVLSLSMVALGMGMIFWAWRLPAPVAPAMAPPRQPRGPKRGKRKNKRRR